MNIHILSRRVFSVLLTGLIAICFPARGQSGVNETLKKLMQELRTGKGETVSTSNLYQSSNAASALQALAPYYQDSLYTVRIKAFSLAANIGSKASNPTLRKQAVNALLQGCNDSESGIVGTCTKALQQFSPIDFDDKARRQLETLLIPNHAYLNNLAKLAGFLGQPEFEEALQNLLLQPKLAKKDKWAVQLALARMGNSEMISRVVSRIKSISVNDDLIYEAAPALVYIRQPQSMEYLFEIMMSDNRSCESANPDSDEKILCAYRVLEYIAPVVKDFPLKPDESGDLEVNDYQTALQTARNWYNEHQNNYTLIKDTF